jgi:hypothetical protein
VRKEYYIVISKSGFTRSAQRYPADQNMILLELKDLGKIFADTKT